MHKKILYISGEGLGNCIQQIPSLCTIREVLGYDIDYWHVFSSFKIPKIIPYCDKWFFGGEIKNINLNDYIGIVSTGWASNHCSTINLPLLNNIRNVNINESEVDTYMYIARDLGVKEKDIKWYGNCNYNESKESYDVVIHNGYNYKGDKRWKLKSYPYYKDVIKELDGLNVCSVGSSNEYIEGTINRTGLHLLDTLGIIKNCKLFVSNDSGLYHNSNALSVPNLVLFTFTSTVKNYDVRFHKYSTIIKRDDLECIGCQNTPRFKECVSYECREIKPEIIINKIMEMLSKE